MEAVALMVAAGVPAHDVGFGLLVGGAGAIWIGAMNLLARRIAARRWGQLGSPRAIWFRYGFFLMPDWISAPILLAGVTGVIAGFIVQTLS